jgi:hypothetical protein
MEIKNFCRKPNYSSFLKIPEYHRLMLVTASNYCIEKDIGNTDLATKIVLYDKLRGVPDDNVRGIRALLLALKLLQTKELKAIRKGNYPIAIVHFRLKKSEIKIGYELDPKLPDMFTIIQKVDTLGVNKELMMYYNDLKEYILETFITYPSLLISKISIQLTRDSSPKDFYDLYTGVVWSNEDCVKCLKMKKPLSAKCIKLLKTCQDKIKYRPGDTVSQAKEIGTKEAKAKEAKAKEAKAKAKEDPIIIPKPAIILPTPVSTWTCNTCVLDQTTKKWACDQCISTAKKWTCDVCLLENPADKEKCIACESARK